MNQIPVPVVRAIILDAENRVLLLRRREGSAGGGLWCLPGGKADYGHTVEDSLLREVSEETGLRCVHSEFLFYQDNLPLEPGGMHCVNLVFRCEVEGEVVLNAESTEYVWAATNMLHQYRIAFLNDEALTRYFNSRRSG